MRVSLFALAAATAVSAQSSTSSAPAAPVVTSNPAGVSYIANLPEKESTPVRGSIIGSSGPDGKGVRFVVAISGLPTAGGPFMYHIHEKPVPADGNCTGAGAHLDPYKRGEVPPCNPESPASCQTGDLSGKYGNFTEVAAATQYLDSFTSTDPSNPSFFGNLSIVIHFSNKTRITCANFTVLNEVTPTPSASSGFALPTGSGFANHSSMVPTGTGSGTNGAQETTFNPPSQPTQPSAPGPSNGAQQLMIAGGALLAGAVALVL